MPEPQLPPPWPAFLSEVDKALSSPVELHCLGGFVLTVYYDVPRATADLDYITVAPNDASEKLEHLAGRQSKLAAKHKVYLQHAGGLTDLPEDYEERLLDLNLGLANLYLKVLDPYDLILSKLTRNSPKDREDVKYLAAKLKLSFGTMYERFSKEMKPWLPNVERHELTLVKLWQEYFAANEAPG